MATKTSGSSVRNLLKQANKAFDKERGQETLALCQQILRIDPNHTRALYLASCIYFAAGKYDNAIEGFNHVLATDQSYVDAYIAMAKAYGAKGMPNEGVQVMQKATQIAPENPAVHSALVSLFLEFNHAHLVPNYLENILPHFPDNLELLQFYTMALKVNERWEEANRVYDDMMDKHKVPAYFQVSYKTFIPRLMTSAEQIEDIRKDYEAALDDFIKRKPPVNIRALTMTPSFNLAYHNRDNKQLMLKYIKMLRLCIPELNFTAPHCRQKPDAKKEVIQIGVVSRFLHEHSVGRCYRALFPVLQQQSDMNVTLFIVGSNIDEHIQGLQDAGITIKTLPKNHKSAQKMIADHKLDVMIFPDLGMDAITHYLAMSRFAPYQMCLVGHPDTTGIDTIDYFISNRFFEVEKGAQENYSETLLLNDCVDTMFERPKDPSRWYSRSELGLPQDKKLYTCPMAIQKLHPDFDDILKGILDKDPDAHLMLFNDYQLQSASEKLQARILSKCDASRITFLGWQPMEKLWSILKESDAVLSTIYFGAGTTSQYCFAYGIPMVSMTGKFARANMVHAYTLQWALTMPPQPRRQRNMSSTPISLRMIQNIKMRSSTKL